MAKSFAMAIAPQSHHRSYMQAHHRSYNNRTIAPTNSQAPWYQHIVSGEQQETVFESIRIRDDADEPTWMYLRRLSKIVTGGRPILEGLC
ncbi:MAG: hypothetical protein ACI9CB_002644 [Rhodothermales bacterium]|jgi:hypothetical protein